MACIEGSTVERRGEGNPAMYPPMGWKPTRLMSHEVYETRAVVKRVSKPRSFTCSTGDSVVQVNLVLKVVSKHKPRR